MPIFLTSGSDLFEVQRAGQALWTGRIPGPVVVVDNVVISGWPNFKMATAKPLHVALFTAFVVGLLIYFVHYIRHTVTPKIKADCQDVKSWCRDEEVAKTCGVLEFCQMQWQVDGLNRNKTDTEVEIAKPVDVVVYFESLCPDSERFIKEQLYPTYRKLYGKHVFTLELIPYGNAKETKKGGKWTFSCQHGEDECIGNILETCAIHELQNVTQWMPFVYCMELNKATVQATKKCSQEQHANFKAIEKCSNGPLGNELQHKMALRTAALKPKHTFIPWITVNGKSKMQTKALFNFLELICDTYEGKRPVACPK